MGDPQLSRLPRLHCPPPQHTSWWGGGVGCPGTRTSWVEDDSSEISSESSPVGSQWLCRLGAGCRRVVQTGLLPATATCWEPDLQVIGAAALAMTSLSTVPRQHLSKAPFITHSVPVRPRPHLLPDTGSILSPVGRGPSLGARKQAQECCAQTAWPSALGGRRWGRARLWFLADKIVQKCIDSWLFKFSNCYGDYYKAPAAPVTLGPARTPTKGRRTWPCQWALPRPALPWRALLLTPLKVGCPTRCLSPPRILGHGPLPHFGRPEWKNCPLQMREALSSLGGWVELGEPQGSHPRLTAALAPKGGREDRLFP